MSSYLISSGRIIFIQFIFFTFTPLSFLTCFAQDESRNLVKTLSSKNTETVFREGQTAFNSEDYKQSIELFYAVLEKEKNNYPAAYYLALSISRNMLGNKRLSGDDFSKGWNAFYLASKNAQLNNRNDEKLSYAMSWYALMEYLTLGREMTKEKKQKLVVKIEKFSQEAIKINPEYSDSYNILGALDELNEKTERAIPHYSIRAKLGNLKSQENFYRLSSHVGNIYFSEAETSIASLQGRVFGRWADNPHEEILFGIQYWNSSEPGKTGKPRGRASDDRNVTIPNPLLVCCAWGYQGSTEKSNTYSGWYTPQSTVRLAVKDKDLMDKIINAAQNLVAMEVQLEGRTIIGFKVKN